MEIHKNERAMRSMILYNANLVRQNKKSIDEVDEYIREMVKEELNKKDS